MPGQIANVTDPKYFENFINKVEALIKSNNVDEVFEIMRKGFNINTINAEGENILHYAAKHNKTLFVTTFALNAGPYYSSLIHCAEWWKTKDKLGRSPLWHAVDQNNIDMVNAIVAARKSNSFLYDPFFEPFHDFYDPHLINPVFHAIEKGRVEIVKSLARSSYYKGILVYSVNDKFTNTHPFKKYNWTLAAVLKNDDVGMLQTLEEIGLNLNEQRLAEGNAQPHQIAPGISTLLLCAIELCPRDSANIVKYLIDKHNQNMQPFQVKYTVKVEKIRQERKNAKNQWDDYETYIATVKYLDDEIVTTQFDPKEYILRYKKPACYRVYLQMYPPRLIKDGEIIELVDNLISLNDGLKRDPHLRDNELIVGKRDLVKENPLQLAYCVLKYALDNNHSAFLAHWVDKLGSKCFSPSPTHNYMLVLKESIFYGQGTSPWERMIDYALEKRAYDCAQIIAGILIENNNTVDPYRLVNKFITARKGEFSAQPQLLESLTLGKENVSKSKSELFAYCVLKFALDTDSEKCLKHWMEKLCENKFNCEDNVYIKFEHTSPFLNSNNGLRLPDDQHSRIIHYAIANNAFKCLKLLGAKLTFDTNEAYISAINLNNMTAMKILREELNLAFNLEETLKNNPKISILDTLKKDKSSAVLILYLLDKNEATDSLLNMQELIDLLKELSLIANMSPGTIKIGGECAGKVLPEKAAIELSRWSYDHQWKKERSCTGRATLVYYEWLTSEPCWMRVFPQQGEANNAVAHQALAGKPTPPGSSARPNVSNKIS